MPHARPIRLPLCRLLLATLLCIAAAAPLAGQATPALVTPNELVAPPATDADLPYVVQVLAPASRGAAVSDALGMLAIGHKPPAAPPAADAPIPPHLSLFKLDAQGQVAETAATIHLPKPASIGAPANYPLSFVFHPTLPLLYVWQDAAVGNPNNVAWKEEHADFDHLLIYDLSAGTPALALATARGMRFANGATEGTLALNADARRLYLPNLRVIGDKPPAGDPGVGYLELDAQGMPLKDGEELKLTSTATNVVHGFPTATGWVIVSPDVALMNGAYGPVVWDAANRRGRLSVMMVAGNAYWSRMSAHPTQPWLFLTYGGTADIYRCEHVDGYPTMIPQRLTVSGGVLHGYPAVMPGLNAVAFGGSNRVHVVVLDAAGRYTTQVAQMALAGGPVVEALAWSEKYGKLYVGVEKLPEKPAEETP